MKELPTETVAFMHELKNTFNKYFPNSLCEVTANLDFAPSIFIKFYLAKDTSEVSNYILLNDPLAATFVTHSLDKEGNLANKICFEHIAGKSIIRSARKEDPKEKYLVYGSIPIAYRKCTNTKDKIIKSFEKYLMNLSQVILENYEEINNGSIHNMYDVRTKIAS